MPRANILSHKEGPSELGLIGIWLQERGWDYQRYWREDFPVIPTADALIVLGSFASVASGHCAAWVPAEMDLVREWIVAGSVDAAPCCNDECGDAYTGRDLRLTVTSPQGTELVDSRSCRSPARHRR